jgi:hypothetical protein
MIEERHFLGALQLAEAMGNALTLESGLHSYQRLAKSSDPTIQHELQRLRSVAAAWAVVEAEYGPGSLLNIEHPFVQRNHKEYGLISDGRIANAIRYRISLSVEGRAENV